jgi:hypothetical protein
MGAYKYLGDTGLAQEIVNDVFVKIWEDAGSITIETSLTSYIYRAIVNNSFVYRTIDPSTGKIIAPFSCLIIEDKFILMKRLNVRFSLWLVVLLAGISIIVSCNKSNNSGTGHLEVRLTDDPSVYDAVYIDVQKVEVNVSSDPGASSGWATVTLLRPGVYNLLNFRNGIDTVLAAADLPAGKLSQMRLVLGDNNSVIIDGQSFHLTTPSAQQSGLKFNIHSTLASDIVYRLWIDFDAGRSIVNTGSGAYILKPVIRTYTEAIGGSIRGYVLPSVSKPQVWAIQGTDSLLALPDPATGYYFFGGVNAGSWNISFHALDSTYIDTAFAVTVSTGVVTNAGTATLKKK